MRKKPHVLQECLLITGRCRVPVEGEEYYYYYYYYYYDSFFFNEMKCF